MPKLKKSTKPVPEKTFLKKMDSKTRKKTKYEMKINTSTKSRSKSSLNYESENILYTEFDECEDTEPISQTTLQELCRVCLKNDMQSMFPLSSYFTIDDYSIMVSDALKCITSQEADTDEKLPSEVCFTCLERIINAYLLVVEYEENCVKLEEMITIFDEEYEIDYLDDASNASDCMMLTQKEDVFQFHTDESKRNESPKMFIENAINSINNIDSHDQSVINDEIWLDLDKTYETEYLNNESNATYQKNNIEIIQIDNDSLCHNEYYELVFENNEEYDLQTMVAINKESIIPDTQITDSVYSNDVPKEIPPCKLNNSTEEIEKTIGNFSKTINELTESFAENKKCKDSLTKINNPQDIFVNTNEESKLTAALNNDLNGSIILNKENIISNMNDVQTTFETQYILTSNYSTESEQDDQQSLIALKDCNELSKSENADAPLINMDVSTNIELIKIKEEPVDLYENRIKCRRCKVTMLKSEITAHMVRCKMKKENSAGSDTKLKLIICKHCNTLLYLNDMVQHSTNCKKLLEETLKKLSASSSEYIKDETVAHDTADNSMTEVTNEMEISDVITDPSSTITYRKIDNISNKRTNNNISKKLTLFTDKVSSTPILNTLERQKDVNIIQNGTMKSTLNNSTESNKETRDIEIRKRKNSGLKYNHMKRNKVHDFVEVCNICNEIFTNVNSYRRHSNKHTAKT